MKETIEKYWLIIIVAALAIGGSLGYWGGKQSCSTTSSISDTNSVTLRWSPEKKEKLLTEHPLLPIAYTEAKNAINNFYIEAYSNPQLIIQKIPFSFGIDNVSIAEIFKNQHSKSNIRLYPALNGKGEVTLVVALEDENGEMQFSNVTTNLDRKLWDYINPCPFDCPPKNDFYTDCNTWNSELKRIAPSFTPKTCK